MVSNSGKVGSAGAPLLLVAGWLIVLLKEGRRGGCDFGLVLCAGNAVGMGALSCVGDTTLGRLSAAAAVDGAAVGAGAAAGLLESAADVDREGVLLIDDVDGSLEAEEPVLQSRYSNKDT